MEGFWQEINETPAVKNYAFTRTLPAARNCQLVLMVLKPNEEIGADVETADQFFRVAEATGEAIVDGVSRSIRKGVTIVVPAGVTYNIVNTGGAPLKLYAHRRIIDTAYRTASAPSLTLPKDTLAPRQRKRPRFSPRQKGIRTSQKKWVL